MTHTTEAVPSRRIVCQVCQRPEKNCLCHAIVRCRAPLPILVWQDPREAKMPLSTTPLLLASVSNCQCFIGAETCLADMASLLNVPEDQIGLVYPADNQNRDDSQSNTVSQQPSNMGALLLLDGTWKQVKRMILSHPWLDQLPRLGLQPTQPSRYKIRNSRQHNGVSTMEAALLACHELDSQFDWQAPLAALDALVEEQLHYGQRSLVRTDKQP